MVEGGIGERQKERSGRDILWLSDHAIVADIEVPKWLGGRGCDMKMALRQ